MTPEPFSKFFAVMQPQRGLTSQPGATLQEWLHLAKTFEKRSKPEPEVRSR